jgi:hypothetical protein
VPHIPKPFKRPGIDLTPAGPKKRWADVRPRDVQAGDLLLGQGLVVGSSMHAEYDHQLNADKVSIRFEMKSGKPYYLFDITPETRVRAFTLAEGEDVDG